MDYLKGIIIKHEGYTHFPYQCSQGKLTIGVGRNLEDVGLNDSEIMMLLDNDIRRCFEELSVFDWFMRLNIVRKGVIVELNFNIGLPSVLTFKKMIKALEQFNYEAAANELLDSLWRTQVGDKRAFNMASRLRKGMYSNE